MSNGLKYTLMSYWLPVHGDVRLYTHTPVLRVFRVVQRCLSTLRFQPILHTTGSNVSNDRPTALPIDLTHHPFNVVRLELNESCKDGLNDLGATGSEIVTLMNQFIQFSHGFTRQQQRQNSLSP